jgi:hypothetical protein
LIDVLARCVLVRRTMTTTAWGKADVLEEVWIKQTAPSQKKGEGRKEFETLVQLLEGNDGESLVRFSYSTDKAVRRGPVTFRRADLAKLKQALTKAPRLKAALKL